MDMIHMGYQDQVRSWCVRWCATFWQATAPHLSAFSQVRGLGAFGATGAFIFRGITCMRLLRSLRVSDFEFSVFLGLGGVSF